jgi:hypothetical protein
MAVREYDSMVRALGGHPPELPSGGTLQGPVSGTHHADDARAADPSG